MDVVLQVSGLVDMLLSRGDNYCLNSKNSLLRKINTLHNVHFEVADYKDLIFKDCLMKLTGSVIDAMFSM